MDKKPPTLREIFQDLDSRLSNPSSNVRRSLGHRMKAELQGVEWVASTSNLVEKIAELLNIELPTLLIQFWKTSDTINEALQRSAAAPGEGIFLVLFDKEIEMSFEPEIEVVVTLSGMPKQFQLKFDLRLKCTVHGVELTILNGDIVSIDSGSCEVEGTLEYRELVLARAPREGSAPISFGASIETASKSSMANE